MIQQFCSFALNFPLVSANTTISDGTARELSVRRGPTPPGSMSSLLAYCVFLPFTGSKAPLLSPRSPGSSTHP